MYVAHRFHFNKNCQKRKSPTFSCSNMYQTRHIQGDFSFHLIIKSKFFLPPRRRFHHLHFFRFSPFFCTCLFMFNWPRSFVTTFIDPFVNDNNSNRWAALVNFLLFSFCIKNILIFNMKLITKGKKDREREKEADGMKHRFLSLSLFSLFSSFFGHCLVRRTVLFRQKKKKKKSLVQSVHWDG